MDKFLHLKPFLNCKICVRQKNKPCAILLFWTGYASNNELRPTETSHPICHICSYNLEVDKHVV